MDVKQLIINITYDIAICVDASREIMDCGVMGMGYLISWAGLICRGDRTEEQTRAL